ncbi:hypothetical protein ACGFZB_24450 [Streptomyces cinerochromogenes]|uniref:Uncharacterized protein n=1 Tax=Streptomyces cinerochromogenes TaxID=66422 RepID=A0ABW7BCD2_9ACTN
MAGRSDAASPREPWPQVIYSEDKVICVALRAVAGPQVYLADVPLAGRKPEEAHQYLSDRTAEHSN